jgi:CspA family cold shock protein
LSDKRDRNNRRPRRGRHDNPGFPPDYFDEQPALPTVKRHAAPVASDTIVDATVVRFDVGRGFGFVAVSVGSPDVFLHINTVIAAGHELVSPGDRLRVRVGDRPRGREVIEVVSVETAKAAGQKTQGTVKWFKSDKGFGFIKPDVGEKDVFIGAKTLRLAGLATLTPGQRVEIEVVTAPKGLEAQWLKIVGSKDAPEV